MTILRLFLLALLLPVSGPLRAQGWEILPDYTTGRGGREQVRRIMLCENYERPSAGYVQLRDSTPVPALVRLTRARNPAMQLYAAYALADRHYPRLAEVFAHLLRKDHPIAYHYHAWGSDRISYLHASEALYDRFRYGEAAARSHRHPQFPSPADSVLYHRLRHQLDSTALDRAVAGRHVHHTLLHNCLADNQGYPGSYAFVQALCRQADPQPYANQHYAAALAAYRREPDIPLLLSFGQNAFSAIGKYPHPAFWPLLTQYRTTDKSFRATDYYRAVAAYRTAGAARLLDSIARYEVREATEFSNLALVLSEADPEVFHSAIATLWEHHHAMALPNVQALIRQNSAQAAALFARGFLSYNPGDKGVFRPQFYFSYADTVALTMLKTIQAQDTALFRRVGLHGARAFRWDELTALCRLDRRYRYPWLRQAFLHALQNTQDPEGAAVLAGELLKYNDPALAAQLRQLLAASAVCGTATGVWCDYIRHMLQPPSASPKP